VRRIVLPLGLCAATALASCASPPEESPPDPRAGEGVPAVLEGVPPAVVVDRALVDLDSGDPARVRHARGVLLAADASQIEPLRVRARTGRPGSPARLLALGALAERGEALDDWAASEVVEMTLREIDADREGGRAAVLGVARLRQMGDAGVEALRAAARPGGPRSDLARRLLALLGEPARALSEARP